MRRHAPPLVSPRRSVRPPRALGGCLMPSRRPRRRARSLRSGRSSGHRRMIARTSSRRARPCPPRKRCPQPDQGKIVGFDFSRDPLNATRPMQPFEEIGQADAQAKPQVMAAQRQLLESRYDLTARPDPEATMARGKPLPVGPTARLAAGTEWSHPGGYDPGRHPAA